VGSLAQVLFAATNPSVRAVVSLDGATGYRYGQDLLDTAGAFARRSFDTPFAHLTGDSTAQAAVPTSSTFFDATVRGPAYLVRLRGLGHAQFTAFGVLAARASGSPDARAFERGYGEVIRYSGWFLDAYLRGDLAATVRLRDPWTALGASHDDLIVVPHAGR